IVILKEKLAANDQDRKRLHAELEQALRQITPRTAVDHADRGWLHAKLSLQAPKDAVAREKYPEKARADFAQALRLDPRLARAHAWRGRFLYDDDYSRLPYNDKPRRKEAYDRALAECNTALRLSPRSAWLHLLRGSILIDYSLGSFANAIDDF